jgi:hypothetical protein
MPPILLRGTSRQGIEARYPRIPPCGSSADLIVKSDAPRKQRREQHGVDRSGQVVVMTIVVTMTGIAAACLIAAWILDCRGK